jgi:hypothetical protein
VIRRIGAAVAVYVAAARALRMEELKILFSRPKSQGDGTLG